MIVKPNVHSCICLFLQVKDPLEIETLVEIQIHSKPEGHTREGSESSAVDTPSIEFIFSSSETTNEEDLWIDPDPGGIWSTHIYPSYQNIVISAFAPTWTTILSLVCNFALRFFLFWCFEAIHKRIGNLYFHFRKTFVCAEHHWTLRPSAWLAVYIDSC